MRKNKPVSLKKGLTLVEIMVVVAVLGGLAMIAIPNYQRYMTRAEQSFAKNELAIVYTRQKAWHAQYKTYTREWPSIGYIPDGIVLSASTYPVVVSRDRIYSIVAGSNPDNIGLWSLPITPHSAQFDNHYPAHNIACPLVSPSAGNASGYNVDIALGPTASFARVNSFLHAAIGCPGRERTTNAQLDRWTINHHRQLVNTQAAN